MIKRFGWLAAFLISASPATAQVWDSPFLASPRPAPGIGLFLIEIAGGGVGAMATWQPSPTSWGFRAGVADAPSDIAVFGGVDVSGALTRSTSEIPLDVDWVFGLGATLVPNLILSAPLGLTVGHTFEGNGTQFTPYATPRLVLDALFDSPGDDDLHLDLAVDIGLDVRLQPKWLVRFGATLGDREALGIGIVFR